MTIRSPILDQLRTRAIIPACIALGLDGAAARNLVLGTAAHETDCQFLAQWPTGPALGFWQIEPATAADVILRASHRQPALLHALNDMAAPGQSMPEQLDTNLLLGAAVCRLTYWLVEEALPHADDVLGMGAYWKKYYNTDRGAGTVSEFVDSFRTRIGVPPDA